MNTPAALPTFQTRGGPVVALSPADQAVPLARAAGLGAILGYLAAGMAIGPWGLKLVTDPHAILSFAEFGVVLMVWVVLNSGALELLGVGAFDAYPFIFLNLMLSMLAAVQAPIILMSQNRQARKDRITARHDYEVNLRTQLEILRLAHRVERLAQDVRAIRRDEEAAQTGPEK